MLNGQEYTFGEEKLPIECFRCGICCMGYYPQLSPEEVERMAGCLSIGVNEFISEYVQVTKIGYLLRQTENGCVFLTWEPDTHRASCSVHPFRPESCRNWQPSLFRRECREGLAKLQKNGGIMLASDLYESPEQVDKFCASLREPDKVRRFVTKLPRKVRDTN
jgi:Fe-S-cluster containining protein